MPCGSPNPARLRSCRFCFRSITSTVSLPSAATKRRSRRVSIAKWSMRPFTPGIGTVASSSRSAAPAACPELMTPHSGASQISLCSNPMSGLLFESDAPRQSKPQLADRFAAGMRRANADVEREVLAGAPDGADEARDEPRAARGLLAEHFGNRTDRPGVRAFENGPQENIRLVLAIDRHRAVEMQADGLGTLGDDARDGKACPVLGVNGRQEKSIFRRDARAGLL